ncbi:hypothetical protein FACS18949_12520 [Clostridia bacterium]|nr:hypothetical protein FACS189425_09600 [Clostridia bacterium]GHV35141.1 hypothetical protein FACS18949_12520 [Clostridia bacterium]
MKTCEYIGRDVVLFFEGVAPCCLDGKPFFSKDFNGGDFPIGEYIKFSEELIRQNQTEEAPCKHCPVLRECGEIEVVKLPLRVVGISCTRGCPANCIYCPRLEENGKYVSAYDYSVTIKDMVARGIIGDSTRVVWGGGEPVLNEHFPEICEYLADRNISQLILTSGTVYSQPVYNALKQNNITLVNISVDAGTKETYAKVKGINAFDKTWETIKKYTEANAGLVEIKYIVIPENCSDEEFFAFRDKCVENGIVKVVGSADFNRLRGEGGEGEGYGTLLPRLVRFHKIMLEEGFSVGNPLFSDEFTVDNKKLFNKLLKPPKQRERLTLYGVYCKTLRKILPKSFREIFSKRG